MINKFKISFLIAITFSILGSFLKIYNNFGADFILIIGLIATLFYIVIGIIEVNNSNKINNSEKVMWTIGFIALNFLAGLLYLISGRKRII